MSEFYNHFAPILIKDAARVFTKYPKFWSKDCYASEFRENIAKIIPVFAIDMTALLAYYKAEARSKDAVRIFQVVARETIEHHGYGPEQCHFLAVWYFAIVKLTEYDDQFGITDQTDIYGMYQCYLNTGDIDYEHDWSH